MSETDVQKMGGKLVAKRFNERLKLLIVSVNTVALTTFGAAFILPFVSGSEQRVSLGWIFGAVGLHLLAQGLFYLLRSEE